MSVVIAGILRAIMGVSGYALPLEVAAHFVGQLFLSRFVRGRIRHQKGDRGLAFTMSPQLKEACLEFSFHFFSFSPLALVGLSRFLRSDSGI